MDSLVTALNAAFGTDYKHFFFERPRDGQYAIRDHEWNVCSYDEDGGSHYVGELSPEQLEYILNSLLEV